MTKVLVAMSGGVDSSVAAAQMLQQGLEVSAVTLRLGRRGDDQAITDAKMVAQLLGIEHQVLDVSQCFHREVVNYLVDTYEKGKTPNPCAVCNRQIKFGQLWVWGKERGAQQLVTGHYARILENSSGIPELHRARDLQKDQSYFLSLVRKEVLTQVRFPLGSWDSKTQVRQWATQLGLPVATKPESQDVCFGDNYRDVIPTNSSPGPIRLSTGQLLGYHSGIHNYTIGQRKGLGIAWSQPLFVLRLEANTNTVYVGEAQQLLASEVILRDINLLAPLEESSSYTIKLRSTSLPQSCHLEIIPAGLKVILSAPTRAITPGQVGCIYAGDQVICGGWVEACS